jgi:hypothetical protein
LRVLAHPVRCRSMPLSGTIILCDQVYNAQGGKYVIAGTYTTLQIKVPDLRRIDYQVAHLQTYVRVRPEQLGPLALEIRMRDEQQPPWQAPIATVRLELTVTEHSIRLIECPLTLPSFGLRIEGGEQAAERGRVDLRYSLELFHDSELMASTPLDLQFTQR